MKVGKDISFAGAQMTSNLFAPIQNVALYFGLALHGMDIVQSAVGWEINISQMHSN